MQGSISKRDFCTPWSMPVTQGYCELSKEEHYHLPMGPDSQLLLEYRNHSYGVLQNWTRVPYAAVFIGLAVTIVVQLMPPMQAKFIHPSDP